MADYKIELGVKLDTSDIQKQINTAGDNIKPIKIKIDAETKELTQTIKDALKDLSSGTKNALTLDTTKIEASFREVRDVIADIRTSLGTLDNKSGMKSLVSTIGQISKTLDTASTKIENLSKELSALSKKDFSINLGINTASNPIARNTAYGNTVRNETLPQLRQQTEALESYLKQYYKVADGFNAAQKLIQGSGAGAGKANLFDLLPKMLDNTGSLSSQMTAYKEYIALIKEAAGLKNVDISGVLAQFSKQSDELVKDAQDIQTGAKETENALKSLFGSGIDADGLNRQLDSIVSDLGEIRTTIQSLSSGNSIDGLTQSFNRLSETLERLTSNLTLAKNSLDTGFSNGNAVKSAEQLGRKIGDTVEKSVEQSINIDDVIDKQVLKLMNEYAISSEKGSNAFNEIRQSLVDFRNGSADINKVTSAISNNMKVVNEAKNDYKDLAEYIKMFNASGAKVHIQDSIRQEYGDDYKSMRSQLGKGFTSGQGMDFETFIVETNEILGQTIDLSHGAEAAFGDLVNKVNSTKGSKFLTGDDLFRSGILDMGDVVANVSTSLEAIENAEEKIAQASVASANTVVQNEERKQQAIKQTDDAIDSLSNKKTANIGLENVKSAAENASDAIRQTVNEAKKLDNVSIDISDGDIDGLRNALKNIKVDDSDIEEMISKLKEMGTVAKSVSGTLKDGSLVKWDVKGIQATVDGLERVVTITNTLKKDVWTTSEKYSQAFDKMASTAAKIQAKLNDTGFDGFVEEVQRAHIEVEKLQNASIELQTALKQLDVAFESIELADQDGDIKGLVAANKKYEDALKQVYSQLKLNQQAEKELYNQQELTQSKKSLSLDMDNWLKENTRVAKDFGDEIRRLQHSLDSLDADGVKEVGHQFDIVKKQAQNMGKTGLTVFDKLKNKFKEYAAYLSAAEIFMYVEQALQDMFEQVKLIDSAMTELKKVTDETDASYNKFLSNAASRAKEIGTTIDGLIQSTASFARLGYGFEDAQGLAEVANIYAVVGDEVEGVEGATESLISTMAAFKDEMGGMSNSDFAMGIIDIFNELGNNFAISSGGLGEALERSASSLAAANNTIHESAALITAANTVVQNPEKVGNAMKTKFLNCLCVQKCA